MKIAKLILSILVVGLLVLFAVISFSAQQKQKRKNVCPKKPLVGTGMPQNTKSPLQCTAQNTGNEKITYRIGSGKLIREEKSESKNSEIMKIII